MGKNIKPPWVIINDTTNTAECTSCGGKSIFIPMINWYRSGKHFTKWDWRKGFKKAHRSCKEKKHPNIKEVTNESD